MATITTRSGKGSPLTNTEVDNNFTNLNTDKVEKSGDTLTGDLAFGDNVKAKFGASNDLRIYHDGAKSVIEDQGTGALQIRGTDLKLRSSAVEEYIECIANGAVTLYYDNSAKLATTSSGVDVTGTITFDGGTTSADLAFNDGVKAKFGISNALQVFHNGNGRINNVTGDIIVTNFVDDADVRILTDDGSGGTTNYIRAKGSTGEVILYHYGSEKLKSQSTGIDVTGTVTANALTVDGNVLLNSDGSQIQFENSNYFIQGSDTFGYLRFNVNGSEAARFRYDGRLGIGTTSPDGKLHIDGASSSTTGLVFEAGNEGNNRIIDFQNNSGAMRFGFQYDNSNVKLSLVDSGRNETVTFDSLGNVGIGTTSPSGNLDITSSAVVSLDLQGGDGNSKNIIFRKTTGGEQLAKISAVEDNLRFTTGATSERMRIDSSGNLLVGGTTTNHQDGSTQEQFSYINGSYMAVSRSQATTAYFNRQNSDGDIAEFRKDGSTIGSIGVDNTDNIFLSGDSSHSGLMAGSSGILPYANGSITNATEDLGQSGINWRNLYLSGGIRADTLAFSSTSGLEYGRFDSSGNLLVGTTDSTPYSTTGSVIGDGLVWTTRANAEALLVNRTGSDGTIATFRRDGTTEGSIGYKQSDLYITGGTGIGFRSAGIYSTDSTGTLTDNSSDIGASSFRWKDLYLSGGVYLGGTGSANLLDDYEEGTWTPVFTPATGSFTTMDIQVVDADYVKIGRRVWVTCWIRTNDVDTTGASGALSISGLPFTASGYFPIHVGHSSAFAGEHPIGGTLNTGNTSVNLRYRASSTSATIDSNVSDLTTGTVSSQNQVRLHVMYTTSA